MAETVKGRLQHGEQPGADRSTDSTVQTQDVEAANVAQKDDGATGSELKERQALVDQGKRVEFDTERLDPDNPLTWPAWKKWMIIAVVSTTSTCVTCTSSVVATAYEGIERDLHVSHEVAILGLSLFVLGLGCGPLLLGPFSEFFGRRVGIVRACLCNHL